MNGPDQGVSVIVPCFDRAGTVEEAIRSVLDQNWSDLEVIAVDDGSKDDTWKVLLGIDDPRLRCLRNPGKGVSLARNHGVANAKRPWIAFQDSDDIWLPGKLERQMTRLLHEDAGFAAYCGMLVKEDARAETKVQRRYPDPGIKPLEGDILPSLCRDSFISTQTLVIRRDVFDAVGGFDEALEALVDWELMLRVAQVCSVVFVDEDLVVQRMSENSITRSSRRRLMALEAILEKHAALIGRFPGALAHHHNRLAGAYRHFGEYEQAARHAKAAFGTGPFRFRQLVRLLVLRLAAVLEKTLPK